MCIRLKILHAALTQISDKASVTHKPKKWHIQNSSHKRAMLNWWRLLNKIAEDHWRNRSKNKEEFWNYKSILQESVEIPSNQIRTKGDVDICTMRHERRTCINKVRKVTLISLFETSHIWVNNMNNNIGHHISLLWSHLDDASSYHR